MKHFFESDAIFPTTIRLCVLRALFGDAAAMAEPVLFKENGRKPEVKKVPFALFMKGQ